MKCAQYSLMCKCKSLQKKKRAALNKTRALIDKTFRLLFGFIYLFFIETWAPMCTTHYVWKQENLTAQLLMYMQQYALRYKTDSWKILNLLNRFASLSLCPSFL